MLKIRTLNQQDGSALILTVMVLVAISALGITMITLGTNEINMTDNQKRKEVARYNCDSCTVAISKLVRMVVDESDEGNVGVVAGAGSNAPGIVYAESTTGASEQTEFAQKVLFGLDTGTCEDVSISSQSIAAAVNAAGLEIDPTTYPNGGQRELDSAADIRSKKVIAGHGTASREFAAGYGHGLGEGGAGGGGMWMKFVIACRGRAPGNALHIGYSVYRKVIGVGKGN